jgi:enoyl-CoA hydratase/carnithine racemase
LRFVQYAVEDKVGIITLDRPEKANAQTTATLDELDKCWMSAAEDRNVRVIVVQANGAHFCSGMDLSEHGSSVSDPGSPGEGSFYHPTSYRYFRRILAWRNVPKPSIAAVQGRCVAAGLMLCWPCDLIIAAEDAQFSDPTMRMGLAGIDYMAHIWELGPRKAKEILFLSVPLGADEAARIGMVNRVVPTADLRLETMAWAHQIAGVNPGMAALVKRAVNGAQDTQGFTASLDHGFDLQELAGALHAATDTRFGGEETSVLDFMRRTNTGVGDRASENRLDGGPGRSGDTGFGRP